MTRSLTLPVVAILTSCALLPAYAAGVHKWVDAKGATHYSDEAPTSATAVVTLIKVPTTRSATADAANDYYSIANQWMRLHQELIEREKLTLEKARQKAAQSPQIVYINEPNDHKFFCVTIAKYNSPHLRRGGWKFVHAKHKKIICSAR